MIRLTYKQLKESFHSECNRSSNMSMGREFFQLYEVANFLNAAYVSCIKRRLALFDERYIPADKRPQTQPAPSFPNSMQMQIEFGSLWQTSPMIFNGASYAKDKNGYQSTACGEYSCVFPIPSRLMGRGHTLPYVINLNLHEWKGKDRKANYLCRPVTVSDTSKMSLVFQDNKYMPYIYYRVRPMNFQVKDYRKKYPEGWFDDTPDDPTWYCVEMNYKPRSGGDTAAVTFDCIIWPSPFDEHVLGETQAPRHSLDVLFGYEIALQAAAYAIESLGGDRAASLAALSQQA